jgi:hypothetical protein
MFYRCRTCGAEEGFALCESCFFASDHKDHRWLREVVPAMLMSRFCDCGDESAFVGGVAVARAIHGQDGGDDAVRTNLVSQEGGEIRTTAGFTPMELVVDSVVPVLEG